MFKKSFFIIFLVILSSIPAIFNLLLPGFPLTDDGNWMIIRFSAFYSALSAGELPVRFLGQLNNGFGYPVANFLYPLFMYLGSPIHLLGISFVETIKVILILSIIFSGVFTFFWLKKYFDDVSAFVGSIVYVYFPYHIYDVYKRGSVGEVLALVVLPFLLWQIKRKSILGISVGVSLLILAHNTLAILFLLFIVPYVLIENLNAKSKLKELRIYILSGLLGLGLSSFFWIPAVFDLQYTVFSSVKISDYVNYFADINLIGNFSIAIIVAVVLLFIKRKLKLFENKSVLFFVALSVVIIFMSLPISRVLWNLLPVSFIQFPFRVLSVLIVSVAFLSAVLTSQFKKNVKYILAILISGIFILSAIPFLTNTSYQNNPDSFFSTNQDTTTVKNEYMPKWVKNIENYNPQKIENLTSKEPIEILKNKPNQIIFEINNLEPVKIKVNTVYFPGWEAIVNGSKKEINYLDNNGIITLNLNSGENNVILKFKETPLRVTADLISLLSGGLLIVYLFLIIKKGKLKS